jgi:hypothetical protein
MVNPIQMLLQSVEAFGVVKESHSSQPLEAFAKTLQVLFFITS